MSVNLPAGAGDREAWIDLLSLLPPWSPPGKEKGKWMHEKNESVEDCQFFLLTSRQISFLYSWRYLWSSVIIICDENKSHYCPNTNTQAILQSAIDWLNSVRCNYPQIKGVQARPLWYGLVVLWDFGFFPGCHSNTHSSCAKLYWFPQTCRKRSKK